MRNDSPWDADGFKLKKQQDSANPLLHQGKSKILSTIPEMASEELAKQQSNLLVYRQTHINRKAGKRIEWEFIKAD